MSCDVTTGTQTCAPAQGDTAGAACDSRYRNDVVFDAHSTTRWSAVFLVDPGAALVVSAFELAGGTMKVVKVALAAGDMPQGIACPGICDDQTVTILPAGALFPTITHQKAVETMPGATTYPSAPTLHTTCLARCFTRQWLSDQVLRNAAQHFSTGLSTKSGDKLPLTPSRATLSASRETLLFTSRS
jgi:hypothetical protein